MAIRLATNSRGPSGNSKGSRSTWYSCGATYEGISGNGGMTGNTPEGTPAEGGAGSQGNARPIGSAWTLDGPLIAPGANGRGATRAKRPRGVIAFVLVVALLAVAVIAARSYLVLRTKGSPGETAAGYLSAWQGGNAPAMRELSVRLPAGGLAGPPAHVDRDPALPRRHLRLRPR